MTLGIYNLFNKLHPHSEWPLLQDVRTKTTSARSIFANTVTLKAAATGVDGCGVADMTTDQYIQWQICIFIAETDATSWSLSDIVWFTGLWESEIFSTTVNWEKLFRKELSICLIEIKASWKAISIQQLLKAIETCISHCRYPYTHSVTNLFLSILKMGAGDNLTSDSCGQLDISNLKEACQSTNKVNYIWHMPQLNDWYTGLDYMAETQSYLSLQCWCHIDSVNHFNLLSATDKC